MEYWGSRAAGILAFAKETKRFLIAYRSIMVNEPHTWGIVGGKIERGEDFIQGATREFVEETSFDSFEEIIPVYRFSDRGFQYQNFIGIAPKEFSPVEREDPWEGENYYETEEFRWVSLEELVEIPKKHFGVANLLKDEATFKFMKKLSIGEDAIMEAMKMQIKKSDLIKMIEEEVERKIKEELDATDMEPSSDEAMEEGCAPKPKKMEEACAKDPMEEEKKEDPKKDKKGKEIITGEQDPLKEAFEGFVKLFREHLNKRK